MKKKLVLMTSALMAISLLTGCDAFHTHDWGEVTYTWSSDNATCTAERVCKGDESHKETETANSTYAVVTEAKCETDGKGRYSVSFENEAFVAQSKDIVLNAIGHEWGAATYVWADDNSSCTATRVCAHDASHKETETKNSTFVPITPATCTEAGVGKYVVEFENSAFTKQEKDNIVIDALNHDYQFVEFVWGNDFTAQAKYVCSHDASHIKNETATVTNEVTTPAGCETEGVRTYTASFDGHTDTKTEVIPATQHNWGEATYVWADDNSSCTATRVCAHDASHKETETKNSTFVPITPATCTEAGVGKYVVEFENSAFTKQEKDNIVIKALGHDYQFDSFVWSDKWDSAQAKYVCSRDASHVELHDAEVEINTVPAACESTGKKTFTATYDGHTEVKEATIPAKGHNLVHVDEKAANCTEDGNVEHWHCNDCEKNFADEAGSQLLNNVVIEKLGHSWGEPTYEWNADYTECTATRVCARDGNHEETETVPAPLEVTTPNTCEGTGSGTRTATFTNEAFATQTVDVVIDAKGHDYKVISYTWSDDYSECTAKAVCQNDNEHVIEETKSSNLNKYDVNGVIKFTYTASFNNKDIFQDAEFVALILTPINNNAAYSVKAGDKSLKGDIEIPSEYGGKPVTAIDNNGFKECKSLKSVVIPESITSIGDWAFGSCSNLVSTNLPSGLTGLGSYAFYDCSKLSSDIVIPAGITSISWRAFDGDRSITSITFAPGCNITSIGFSAFGDAAITEITLPASLTYIDEMAFWGCEKLQTINFLGTVEQWIAIGKGEDWCFDVPCSTIHCSDGTTPCVNVEDNEYYDDWD